MPRRLARLIATALLSTTACGTPRTVVVKVPVPVVTPPCVQYRAPTPPEGMAVGTDAETRWLASWARWTAYVETACETAGRPEWPA